MRESAAARERLERLRRWRVPRRDVTLRPQLDAAIGEIRRQRSAVGGFEGAWASVVPREFTAHASIESWRSGVLTVRAADSSVMFGLDRFLRAGGQAALAARSPRTLHRVRIVIAKRAE